MAISAILFAVSIALYAQAAFADDARYQSGNWTAETIALDKADRAATEYAENNLGVGILIHLGMDVPNQRVKDGDELGKLFVDRFAALGVDARYFFWQNDTRATGLTYHIGHLLYEADGNPVIGLQTAWNDVPKVIEQLKRVKLLPR